MSSTLEYRNAGGRDDEASGLPLGRPPIVTAVATAGVCLAALQILAQNFRSQEEVIRATATWLEGRNVGLAGALAFCVGLLARNVLNLLMLVGCCGLLALRRSSRRTVIIASYGWIAGGLIELFALYSVMMKAATSGTKPSLVALVVPAALVILADIAFPIWAIRVLVRAPVRAVYAAQLPGCAVVPRRWRWIAVAILTCAALWTADGVVTLVHLINGPTSPSASSSPQTAFPAMYRIVPRVLPLPMRQFQYRFDDSVSGLYDVDAALWTVLNATLLTGCILVLTGRPVGAWIVVACCLVRMACLISAWGGAEFWGGLTIERWRAASAEGMWIVMTRYVNLMAGRIGALLWPALAIIVFTQRTEPRLAPPRFGTHPAGAAARGRSPV
jgi:hypothetical protein